MDVEYMRYLFSIIHFLQTVTIKFDPFVTFLNNKYRDILPVKDEIYVSRPEHMDEQIDISTFPYYINLMGNYHKYNIPVYITDIHNNNILLSRSNIEQYPELKTYYSTNFEELNKLYYRYPQSIEIIKCSLYPISYNDYNELHNASNLSLLGYGKGILDENEEQNIITFIELFLNYIGNRWYVAEFNEFENMYPHVWWSTIWFLLFIGIMTKRILNIKSSFVNDYHIIEYLYSNGFERCRYCFDDYIRKFLYKNYRYLLGLKGQNAVLELLDKYILGHFGFKIFKYYIQKHTYNRNIYADWEPEVILTDINDNPINPIIDFDKLLYELYTKHRIPDYNTYSNEKIYNTVKFNKYNQILTKYLSLSQHNLNAYYDRFVFPLIFDFTVDMISQQKLSFMYDINDILPIETYGSNVNQVFPVELLYLYTYCMYQAFGIDCQNYQLPTQSFGLTINKSNTMNTEFYINNQKFDIRLLTDINKIRQSIYPIPTSFMNRQELTKYISKIFNIIIESTILSKAIGDLITCNAHAYMLKQLFPKKVITLSKPYDDIQTFGDYFNVRSDIKNIFTTYTKTNYVTLANNILTILVNIDQKFSPYISIPKILIDEDCLYTIFDKLSSYNVNYLTKTFYNSIIVDNVLIRTGITHTSNNQGKTYVNDKPLNMNCQSVISKYINNINVDNRFNITDYSVKGYSKLQTGSLMVNKTCNIAHKTIGLSLGLNVRLMD